MKLKTISIHGKNYVQVNDRVAALRTTEEFKDFAIETQLISYEKGECIVKCFIKDVRDRVVATGYAHEKEGSSKINKTSLIENCETSAVGRALGFLGIGINESIASYEEVQRAQRKQEELEVFAKTKTKYFLLLKEYYGEEVPKEAIEEAKTMTKMEMEEAISELEKEVGDPDGTLQR